MEKKSNTQQRTKKHLLFNLFIYCLLSQSQTLFGKLEAFSKFLDLKAEFNLDLNKLKLLLSATDVHSMPFSSKG